MPDGYDNEVWDVLLEHPPVSLTPLAQRLIGHGLRSLYAFALTEEPTGRLAELLDMLDKAPTSAQASKN